MANHAAQLQTYLHRMVELNASDLYLQSDERAYYRVAGKVEASDQPAPSEADLRAFVDLILTPVAAERFQRSPDIDASYTLPGVGRFRINCFSHQGKPAMVVRLIPLGAVEFDSLGLPETIRTFADARQGLVMLVGPTGCGKSTTLASLIHHINQTRHEHIVTIEDPIEFVHEPINCLIHQRQVGYDTESFATALRHVVRQSPDVILIGEMRDRDTMETALSAALTGHLVFTTLHTTNVVQSIDRMLNYFPPDARQQAQIDLGATLVGMVSMRLVPTKDGKSRRPAVEIVRGTPTVRRVIAEGAVNEIYDLMKRSGDAGMLTLNQSLVDLVRNGDIDDATALRHSIQPDELKLTLQGMFTGTDSIRIRE